MKNTNQMYDEIIEEQYYKEKYLIQIEREMKEQELMQELFEIEKAKIVLGTKRKRNKFVGYAKIGISGKKLPRFAKRRI
jgi:hypothetical protein